MGLLSGIRNVIPLIHLGQWLTQVVCSAMTFAQGDSSLRRFQVSDEIGDDGARKPFSVSTCWAPLPAFDVCVHALEIESTPAASHSRAAGVTVPMAL
jgi:hypothetical protein